MTSGTPAKAQAQWQVVPPTQMDGWLSCSSEQQSELPTAKQGTKLKQKNTRKAA